MSKVAVLGLGVMGRGMAANLLKNGHELIVWNRTATRAEPFVAQGAKLARTPAEAAAAADLVFEVTADDQSSREVWLGSDGILQGANSGTVLITAATLSIDWVEELATHLKGRKFLDMPLTGGSVGADTGNLVLLTGGDLSHLEGFQDVLEAISAELKHFGPVGSGTKYKLVLNSLQAIHFAAFGEMMRVATAAGLDPELVGPALVQRPGGVATQLAWKRWGEAIPEPASFATAWAAKDVEYAARLGDSAGVPAHPILDGARTLLAQAVAEGNGQKDWSIINRP